MTIGRNFPSRLRMIPQPFAARATMVKVECRADSRPAWASGRFEEQANTQHPQGISLVIQVSGGTLAGPNSAAPSGNGNSDRRGQQGRYDFEGRTMVLLFIF
jgi:hypothetical protein